MIEALLGRIAAILGGEELANGRSLAYVWGFGSLCLTATLVVPHPPDANELALIGVTAVGYLGAGALYAWAANFSTGGLEAITFVGQLLITTLTLSWGAQDAPFLWFHVWLVVHAFHFLPLAAATRQIGCAAVLFVFATVTLGSEFPISSSVVGVGTITAIGLLVGAFRVRVDALLAASARTAAVDPLTGLANRRAFAEAYASESARRARFGRGGALLVLDCDHFKALNDRLGHAAGDQALCHVAQAMSASIRAVDTPARLGGDEFAVLLSEPDPGAAVDIAERIRRAVAAGPAKGNTLSIGITELPPTGSVGLDTALAAADGALYESKRRGGDCVTVGRLEGPWPGAAPSAFVPAPAHGAP